MPANWGVSDGANRGFRAIPRLFTNTGVANLGQPKLIVVVPKQEAPVRSLRG